MSLQFTSKAEPPRAGPLSNQLFHVLNRQHNKASAIKRFEMSMGESEGPDCTLPSCSKESQSAAIYKRFLAEFMELNEKEIKGEKLEYYEKKRLIELATLIPKYQPGGSENKRKSRKARRKLRKQQKKTRKGGKGTRKN
jgi:hypothetical protein